MKIIAKRPFISSRRGIGNVPQGHILDVDDDYAKMLIKAGLAEEFSVSPALKASRQSSFISPVEADARNGQSSQAAQASQKPTAKKSKHGAKKTKSAE